MANSQEYIAFNFSVSQYSSATGFSFLITPFHHAFNFGALKPLNLRTNLSEFPWQAKLEQEILNYAPVRK